MIMFVEIERIDDEAIAAYFNVLFRHPFWRD
jgi:hypothetical protein